MKTIRNRYMKPATEGENGGSAAADRGDDYTPSAEDVEEAAKNGTATPEDIEAERVKLGLPKPAAKVVADDHDLDDDADDEDDAAPAKPAARREGPIPKHRHEAILAAQRAKTEALERQVAALEKGKVVVETNEQLSALEAKITTLEEQYNDAIAEGETKKASALMKEIRQNERTVIEQKAELRTQMATAVAVEQVRFDTAVERLQDAYPQLKAGTDEYDQTIVDEVVELQDAYVLKGYTATKALQKAVDMVLKATTSKQEAAVSVTPRVNGAEATAAAKKLERETAARKKNAEAANAQPAGTQGVGSDSDAAGGLLDAAKAIKLPWEKFAKLDDAELARMRGDTL